MNPKRKDETEMLSKLLVGETIVYAGKGGEDYKRIITKVERTRFDKFVWWFKYKLMGLPQKQVKYTITIDKESDKK